MTENTELDLPLHFVVGTGRCGSTMLSRILALHPEILSASEFINTVGEALNSDTFPDRAMDGQELWQLLSSPNIEIDALICAGGKSAEMAYPYDTGRFRPDIGVPRICHYFLPMLTDDPDGMFDELAAEVPRWPARSPAGQYRAFLGQVAARLGRRVIVERSGASSALPPMLYRQYPDARYVHLYRNGPDTVLSISRFSSARVLGIALEAAKAAGLPRETPWEDVKAAAPAEFNGLLAPPFDVQRIMDYPLPLTFFAGMWSNMMRMAAAIFSRLPRESWMNMKFEDLLADPRAELAGMADFLQVAAAPAWLDQATGLIEPGRPGTAAARLDPAAFAELEAACEPGATAIAELEDRLRRDSRPASQEAVPADRPA
jgi:hypothetical protein